MLSRLSHACAAVRGLAFVGVAVSATAQTVTVTTLHDVIDFGGAHQVADLPGPDGRISMQEACMAVNNTAGSQTIEFAIPTSEFWLLNNMALLELDSGPFVLYDDATTIDFTSQTRNIGDTNTNGQEVGVYGLQPNGWGSPAIIIDANDCVIRGLGEVYQRGSAVAIWQGHGNRVVGCKTGTIEIDGSFGGPPTTGNIVGGTTPEDANDLFSVEILCWSDDNVVIGNHIQHVRVSGSQYCVYPARNRIGGPTPEERNVIAGYGYYGEEGFPTGSMVDVNWAQDTLIEGNYIGTTPDGMAREPQIGTAGVSVVDSINTHVRGNLIAGLRTAGYNHYAGQLFGQAIYIGAINGDNQTVVVEGNLIGLAADGVTPIETLNGVVVAPMTSRQHVRDIHIGGELPGQGNEIATVERHGVYIFSLENGVTISGNSIHGCGLLGIELALNTGADGPTPNDPLDADTAGANRLQNFPVLTAATTSRGSTTIVGNLPSAPNKIYRVEYFASQTCDPTGFGEGQVFLGFEQLATDAAGNAPIDVTLGVPTTVGWLVTATATDVSTGDTSEFSACTTIAQGANPLGDMNCDGSVNGFDVDGFVLALSDPVEYDVQYPDCDISHGDVDGDGSINGFDVDGFVALLGG
ncbi:MAG: hypothetical protein CHACPFDD_00173 [Phycisphaerae bacterium]|nr:hypothetical protein [Phycisphaerae bacterium]